MKPRNVRNFWLSLAIDGRKKIVASPKTSDGGFNLIIYMRDNGEPKKVASVTGLALDDGRLALDFWEGLTNLRHIETKR